MSQHNLILWANPKSIAKLSSRDFVWRPPPDSSSFSTSLSPRLDILSTAKRRNVELVRLAVLVYLVDRTQPRPRPGWSRTLELDLPVWEPDLWNLAANDLGELLGFLTSDTWTLRFRKGKTPRSASKSTIAPSDVVALFSGGADSLCGALIAQNDLGMPPTLVSHWDSSVASGAQNRLVNDLESIWGNAPLRFRAKIGRSEKQIGSGVSFQKEASSRSRSFLFIALGLAVASVNGAQLWIPENGFASINPPFGGERRGSLSTRTTHSWYLWRLKAILEEIGAHAKIANPFASYTKGEMFSEVASILGASKSSEILSNSHSRARGGLHWKGRPGVSHCGVCFGCLVRRAAFKQSGVKDQTKYIVADLNSPVGATSGWLADLQATRYAAARGVDPAGICSDPLPPGSDIEQMIGIASRGLEELKGLVL